MWLILLVVAVISFIVYIKWSQTYWQRKGVPTYEHEFFFGHFRNALANKISAGEDFIEKYNKLTKLSRLHAGLYFFWRPLYIPLDPQLIKAMMVRDFNHFMDHGVFFHPKDIDSMHVFALEGDLWRRTRQVLTPAFTTGKIKNMFMIVVEKTNALHKCLERYAINNTPCDMKDILARFTIDVIGICSYGIECNSLEEPNNLYRKYTEKIFASSPLRFWLQRAVPRSVLGNLRFRKHGIGVGAFFANITRQMMKTRLENNIVRNDFMNFMLELRKKKLVIETQDGPTEADISENEIIAQCFVFFVAGFETSSSAMTFAMLELAQNQELQERLRNEVNAVLEKHDRKFSYEAMMEMRFLEQVINESLRKYPPLPTLLRVCRKDYKVPGTEVVIKAGTKVEIPIWGIQRDPLYYPNPEVFDPDRFSPENVQKRPEFTFLPFGEGPRMCIGLRFGMLQAKTGLATMVKNFKFTLNSKTPSDIRMSKSTGTLSVEGCVWLDLQKIQPELETATIK